MKKTTAILILLQAVTTTIALIADARSVNFDAVQAQSQQLEEIDPEKEANQETDAFPDLITFAMHLYQ